MKEFKATRSFTKFYLAIFFRVLFLLVMALLTSILHGSARSKGDETGMVIMIIVGFLLLLAAFYTVILFYVNAPDVRLNKTSITIKNKTHYWSALEQVAFTGKKQFKYWIFGENREILMLKFAGQEALYLFDDLYSNSGAIKKFIYDEIVGHPVQSTERDTLATYKIDSSAPKDYKSETFINYKGYQLLSFEGAFQWAMITISLYAGRGVFFDNRTESAIFTSCVVLFYLGLFMGRMYYFKMSENYLIVKNFTKFWIKDSYLICDIREIVFEQHPKMPVSMRIITNDFENKLYPAASLWDRHWRQLRDDLKSKGITIRMECSIG